MAGIRMSGLVSGLDTESIVKELMSAQRTKSTKIQNKITKLEWKQEKWKDLNTKLYSFYTNQISKMRLQSSYNVKKATASDTSKVDVSASNNVPEGTHTIRVESVASAQYVTSKEVKDITGYSTQLSTLISDTSGDNTITLKTGGKEYRLVISDETQTEVKFEKDPSNSDVLTAKISNVADFVSALQMAGLNASFDTTHHRFFISSKQSGENAKFDISSTDNKVLEGLGFSAKAVEPTEETAPTEEDSDNKVITYSVIADVEAADAIIYYNKAEIKSSSNTITVNGLTINVKERTGDDEIKVNVSRDTQAVYDSIKSFVKSYNEILKALNEVYYAEAARDFEPLTDEQKEAMTDDQIEKWEKKIKDALLRRDDTVGSLINTLRNKLNGRISYNGKTYSLSSFGITSPDYSEKGLLHIDGDADDTLTAVNEDKLMKALSDDPDAVMTVFTGLIKGIYESMQENLKSSSLKSALSFYNDKEMKDTLDDYKKELSNMEARLIKLENRYYKQFSAMETALSRLNSQSSYLTSMLGTNVQ